LLLRAMENSIFYPFNSLFDAKAPPPNDFAPNPDG